jgi:Tol biopolymer transport system component
VLLAPLRPAVAAFPGANGKIAFESTRDGNWEIYVMNADGTGQTRVTKNLVYNFSPAWSPDGKWLTFDVEKDGNLEIYAMRVGGTLQIRLTNNPAQDAVPSWSPDGKKIVFQSTRDDPNWEIYVMNFLGTLLPTRLTNNPCQDVGPDFSPDGSKITWRQDCGFNGEIWVMNADGSEQTRLTNTPGGPEGLDGGPDWQPLAADEG